MRPGEIYLTRFPFGDVARMKPRPALVLTGSVGSVPEVLVAYISSVIPSQLLPSDLILDPDKAEFRSTQLKTVSALRLHKLATVHASGLIRYLGALDSSHRPVIAAKLKTLFELEPE